MSEGEPSIRSKLLNILILSVILLLNVQHPKSSTNTTPYRQPSKGVGEDYQVHKPQHPAREAIREFYCEYGSPACDGGYVDDLISAADFHSTDPYFIVALSILESSGGIHSCGYNWFGYASCAVSFEDFSSAVFAVAKTLRSYENRGITSVYGKASVWRTGGLNDTSGYPAKINQIITDIQRG